MTARSASARAPGDRPVSPLRRLRRRRTVCSRASAGIRVAGIWTSAPVAGLNRGAHHRQPRWTATSLATPAISQRVAGGDAMTDKHILHMLTPLKHMSPFDVNMALDAGYDAAIAYHECDARGGGWAGAGRDLLASAQDRRADGHVHRRQECDPRSRHAGRRQEGAGAAVRHLVLRRSGRIVHHRGGHGGVRREDAASTRRTAISRACRSRSSARPAWSASPPRSSPPAKAPTSPSSATTASNASSDAAREIKARFEVDVHAADGSDDAKKAEILATPRLRSAPAARACASCRARSSRRRSVC